jgi:repressor LexA
MNALPTFLLTVSLHSPILAVHTNTNIMNERTLSEKQQAVLSFIEAFQIDNGYSPTIREIKEFLEVQSDNSVLKHLQALEKKGFIEKDPTARGIKLLHSVKEQYERMDFKLPLIGAIPAGTATLCEENIEAWISVAENLVPYPEESYLLKVQGESMINAGIQDGDTVIVHARQYPRNNDIVVALVDGMNTLKRYVYNGERAYLKAENPDYTDIYPANELSIQGVVTGVFRSYS